MLALVAHREDGTNGRLAAARAGDGLVVVLHPAEAERLLGPGDAALGRLDVRSTLDGVEPGLWTLGALASRGVTVLNPPSALLTAHDKLLTARALARAGVPHPQTRLVLPGEPPPDVESPVVVKPRFGSWGRDVVLCPDGAALRGAFALLARRPWFRSHGALVQELVPSCGTDLRLVVAAGAVIGAIERHAAPGEWRTNVALGATRHRVDPPATAVDVAVAAAAATGASLVGVDLLPCGDEFVVLELNGAVDFTLDYASDDVFELTVEALLASVGRPAVSLAVAEPAL